MKNKFISSLAGLFAGLTLAALPEASAQTQTLIPLNGTWNYLDTGIDPIASWTSLGFDDSSWKTGAAELGYGDSDETTVVNFGPRPQQQVYDHLVSQNHYRGQSRRVQRGQHELGL